MVPDPVGDHRVTGLVDRHGVALALHVLHILGKAQFFQLLGPQHVRPADVIPAVADGEDEGLVDEVLDGGARRVGRDGGELVDLHRA